MKILKPLFIIIVTIVLVILFTPTLGNLYIKFFGPIPGSLWGIEPPQYVEGFFMSYALFVSLAVFIFGQKKKLVLSSIFVGLFILLDLWIGFSKSFLVDCGLIVIAFLLAQGMLMVAKRLKFKV